MNTLKDNGVIKEIECGNNFEYLLEDNAYFVNTDYKVLQSQTNGIFVPCMKMTRNGKTDLYYVIDDYRSMSSMFVGITPDTLISVVVNLFASVIEVRNNGFLACQSIDLSLDKIFVEPNTLKVKLVYLPLSVRTFESYGEFESELRSSIVKMINKVIETPTERLNQFVQDLCNGSKSLEDVYNKSRSVGTAKNGIKIVAMNAPEYFEMIVEKDEMLIGKKKDLVDAVIPFNNMISRKHCRITRLNGNFYISDEGSANGTYLNQVRLARGQRCQIHKGDIIRLADSDFQIV